MPYLIDSDWTIDQLADQSAAVTLLSRLAPDGIAISIITYMEVYQGILTSPTPDVAAAKFAVLVDSLPVLPFSIAVARRCAGLRFRLRSQGKRVNNRALDLIIAATVLAYDLTLVTRNRRDYDDIPGLRLYH